MASTPMLTSRASVTGASFTESEPTTLKRTRHSISSISTTRSSSWGSLQGTRHRDSISGRWVDDADVGDCRNCERPFTLINRRHHCRICGHIFCNQCSRTRMMIATPATETVARQRVCDPCALQAQSSVILYDLDDISELPKRRLSHVSTEDSSEFQMDTTPSSPSSPNTIKSQPSANFMVASMICFATSFWFLKDEVSRSNPAIWILLAGFIKNLYQLIVSFQNAKCIEPLSSSVQQLDMMVKHEEIIHTTESSPPKPKKHDNPLGLNETNKSEMIDLANCAVNIVNDLALSSNREWTSELPSFEIRDVALYSRDGKPSRIYKCEAMFDISPESLFDILYAQFATSYAWNITAAENRIVQTLNDDTDIVHITSAPALGGMISSRDFINTRTWRKYENTYIIGSVSAGNLFLPAKGVTRGENGHTGFVIRPHDTSPQKSHMTWILNCDIKGYFPGSLIKKGSLSEMCCFVRNLRRHIAVTNGSGSSSAVSTT